MTENFFSAYGTAAADVDENPFVAPDNTYAVAVTKAEVTDFAKDNGPKFFSIEYSITKGAHTGKRANQLFRMTPLTAADQEDYEASNARTLSNFKKAMLDLGLKEEALNVFNPNTMGSRLVGISGTARIFPSKREGYNNIQNFQRPAAPVEATPVADTSNAAPDADAVADLLNGF